MILVKTSPILYYDGVDLLEICDAGFYPNQN